MISISEIFQVQQWIWLDASETRALFLKAVETRRFITQIYSDIRKEALSGNVNTLFTRVIHHFSLTI